MDSLKEKLDRYYSWPTVYMFKFIVPEEQKEALQNLFVMHEITQRKSKNGKYIGFTIKATMPSSEAVLEMYASAGSLEGIVAL